MADLAVGPLEIDHNQTVLFRQALFSKLVISTANEQTLTFTAKDNTIRIDASVSMIQIDVNGDGSFYSYTLPGSGPIDEVVVEIRVVQVSRWVEGQASD